MAASDDRHSAPHASEPIILVVDDELVIGELLHEVLAERGYTVLIARDGQQAIEMTRTALPALVITDYMMPRMNGLELVAHLRANLRTRGIPIILMSAVPPGQARHVSAVLVKPFDIDDVLDQVERLLSR